MKYWESILQPLVSIDSHYSIKSLLPRFCRRLEQEKGVLGPVCELLLLWLADCFVSDAQRGQPQEMDCLVTELENELSRWSDSD